MSSTARSGHAVVLGASIAGLLAARALSESYEKVSVFDRDDLPEGPVNRRGVPQGQHAHGLLARGREILEEFFPGLTGDLVARGAQLVDVQRDCLWVNDGQPVPRTPSGIAGLYVSRPALEAYVRSRVRAIGHVEIHSGHEAVGLIADAAGERITGVRVRSRRGVQRRYDADLVVDATGRGNRGPTWLAELGFAPPEEERIDPRCVYVSREYRRGPGDADFVGTVVSASPACPYGGIAVPVEGDRWIVTLLSAGGADAPPTDPEGYRGFTARLAHPGLRELVSRAEPLGGARRVRIPVSVRRRYERLRRLPEGFVAVGDALCTFNPAYAQGMTVAAAEALVLRDCLRAGRRGLSRRFFARAASVVDVPWDIAVGADLRYPAVVGRRGVGTALRNAYVARLHVAARRHPAVGRCFLRVANLLVPPGQLFAPGVLARVLFSGGRRPAVGAG